MSNTLDANAVEAQALYHQALPALFLIVERAAEELRKQICEPLKTDRKKHGFTD
ncbi:hypothetical protein K5D56_26110 [Pseudomonas cichorii]|nr:hypothetical protein [Pseudomonas cichorii]MBX8557032.1 hypothetical protein [Pseudomonas cichorii]MBX8592853.1 hypothetical protein [Pseudomonas cichorii]